jgi:hypothetical protein
MLQNITEWGKIAGFAGLALGVMFLVFRKILSKIIPPQLNSRQATGIIISLIVVSAAIVGYSAYAYFQERKHGAAVVVFVHSPKSKSDLIIPGRGEVTLVYGTAFRTREINKTGEAIFMEVPDRFFESDAKVQIWFSDPLKQHYHELSTDSLYILTKGVYIDLVAKLFNQDSIWGTVKDFRTLRPIDSAEIRIWGVSTFSNKYGEYVLHIPESKQTAIQTITAFKPGYSREEQKIPLETESPCPFELKPIK